MNKFSLGMWVCKSIEYGGEIVNHADHVLYRATFFPTMEEAETFRALSAELCPEEKFFTNTIGSKYVVQCY
jgi:hypothetical protein